MYDLIMLLSFSLYEVYITRMILNLFFLIINKNGTFLLKDVSENLTFEKVTSPFLLNSLKVSPSNLTYYK